MDTEKQLRNFVKEYITSNNSENIIKSCKVLDKYIDAILNRGYRGIITAATYSKYNAKLLKDKPKLLHPLNYILLQSNLKECNKCKKIKNITEFHKNKNHNDGLSSICGNCDNKADRIFYKDTIVKSKVKRLQRYVKWADDNKLREIYKNCPQGYHVDHIIPLRGKLISGLHVPENLQYLPAKENLKKGNKFKIEG